jgi:hypothetical protein
MNNKEKLEKLKMELSRAIYGQAGYFPHPGWAEEEKKLREEIAKLHKKIEEENEAI